MADFDVNKYIKSNSDSGEAPAKSFDLGSYLEDNKEHLESPQEAPEQSKFSELESGGQGALQGATLGFSDEIGGALGAGMEKLAGNPDKKSLEDLYKEYRDFQRSRNDQAQKDNPKSYLAGNVAGAIGSSALAPMLAPTTIPGAMAVGAATGLGTSNADTLKGAAIDTTLGAGLGLGGGLAAKGLTKVLNPEALEAAGSKAISASAGIKPSKELTTQFVRQGDHWVKQEGSNIIRGIGKTASEEGAAPLTGGASNAYDKTIEALDNNYNKLNPVLESTQQKLNEQLPESIEQAGSIGQKAADFLDNFKSDLQTNPDAPQIIESLNKKYGPYLEQLDQADGNLSQLNSLKKGLQDKAVQLNKAAYDNPASDLKPEAEFVKRLGGIVREHIEDLAGTVDQDAAQTISNTNQTLSKLYTYQDYLAKQLDKPTTSVGAKDFLAASAALASGHGKLAAVMLGGKYAVEKATGQPLSRLANVAAGKAQLGAAKVLDTPAGQLVQKTVPDFIQKGVVSPFTQQKVQNVANPSEATKIATNLYTATDDSLRDVAHTLSQDPSTKQYGESLKKSIDNNDSLAKNQAIFLIMQNSNARKLVTPEN